MQKLLTRFSQYVDTGFKVINSVTRTTTSMRHSNSLFTYVYREFTEMRLSNKLKSVSQKELMITDCILSTPEILSKSYSKERIEKFYVDTGMLDSAKKSCPDLYGMMKALVI